MGPSEAKALYAACDRAIEALTAVEHAARDLPQGDERTRIVGALADVISRVYGSIRAPVVRQYPDLVPAEPLGEPDTELDDDELLVVKRLTPAEVQDIDLALLADCASSWRKVARVVGTAMRQLRTRFPEIPDRYYAQRVVALVEAGQLESEGNLNYMRFSEIRLPST